MIKIDKKDLLFHMQTKNTSYIVQVHKKTGVLQTVYYGQKLNTKPNQGDILKPIDRPFSSYLNDVKEDSLDNMLQEFPTTGFSDYKVSSFEVEKENDSLSLLVFKEYRVEDYKELKTLPSPRKANTILTIVLEDSVKNYSVEIKYSIFENTDVITKHVLVTNNSDTPITINKIMSTSLDLLKSNYELLSLDGAWARERHVNKRTLKPGLVKLDSKEGISSSRHNPFIALSEKHISEHHGNTYGIGLMYSGNFEINLEVSQYNNLRIQAGINSDTFKWELKAGEVFEAPHAIHTFSKNGLNGMSHNLHAFANEHVIPKKWSKKERPVVLNNWEATYFDFTEKKIVSMAKEAKDAGIEMFVLDDGWFGKRNTETEALGDWDVNYKKIPSGIDGLAKKVNDLGLDFGLWIEPEMISEKSELFKEHPEWAITDNRYPIVRGRYQLNIDMSNDEVVEHLFSKIDNILKGGNIKYIKWDMNRPMSSIADKSKYHKYVLGFYKLAKRLTNKYPNILWEGCSAGGNRFDLGTMKYFPQIWTSDDTDAFERVKIQYATSIFYPLSVMSNHVSSVPNHQIKRTTDLKSRQDVSNFGILGYELELSKLSKKELESVKEHIKNYKLFRKQIINGEFTRLESPFEENISGWQVSSKTNKLVLGLAFKKVAEPNPVLETLKLKNLNEKNFYQVPTTEYKFPGDELMEIGLFMPVEMAFGDFKSLFFVLNDKGSYNSSQKISDVKTLVRLKRGK